MTYAAMCDSMGTNGVRHGIANDSALVTCTDAGGGSWALDVTVKNFPVGGSQVEVTNFPGTQAVTGTFWPATQPVSGTVAVSNFPSSQAVTGTFWQATQPVSGSVTATCSGTVAVSNFPATQAVTGTFWQTTQPVSGTFWQATQPVSSAVLAACPLFVTATAAVNTALTTTLPAAGSGLFHYITNIQVTKLYSVVGVAAGAGVIVTTTNLPGSPAFTTEQLASAAGTAAKVVDINFGGNPLKSSAANTTIVCPQQLQTIWRVNVSYYTGT